MVRKGYGMLKALLVITSLVFCAGALFAPPPTAQDAAEWSGVALRYANHWGRSAASVIVGALPSSEEVVRYAKKTGLLPESFANALGDHEPKPSASPGPERSVATPECRLRELDELFRQEHVQEYVRENVQEAVQEHGREAPAWSSHEDIPCDTERPRPWCDSRVQAVLRLLEEDRARRGQSAPSLCSEGQSPSPALRN
jgi:hypothetical protein